MYKSKLTCNSFGLALSPRDITKSTNKNKEETAVDVTDKPKPSRGRSFTRRLSDESGSGSRRKLRGLTPLGTRSYVAPEILTGIRKVTQSISDSLHGRQTKQPNKQTRENESDYGMVADAFSVGTTISHLVTGIPPNVQDDDEFIASKNSLIKKFARKMKRRLGNEATKRAKTYRLRSDLPLDAHEVIRLLTHFDEKRRCTVRFARSLPWINGDDDKVADSEESADMVHSFMSAGGPMVYLKCSEDV